MTKVYKTKENAEKARKHIINTWDSWLKIQERLYIVKYPSGMFHLQDYANRRLNDYERKEMYYEL